ncbi:monoacylglycerol/Diacylglycerol O-acyltransferase-like [Ruditapes philippinarum]|uniref:monoacylglycerol/Diacylglycerol O-acyltransferase-like n=1 Tax=Ruditapes philippinarum TaxID=129788 RepID=UPI00295BC13D|nr:monoacylglycerol/Diacylglycerol O-acyltransferase-like [Ruditapes philippinarum]
MSTEENTLSYLWLQIEKLDIEYWKWVAWMIYPVIISFLLPLIIPICLYCCAIFLHVYQYRRRLRDAYAQDFWGGARNTVAVFWEAQGRIWHGYEIVGLDKVPDTGPAMLIYYHGALPIDFYYVMAKCLLEKRRQIHAVGDNFLFNIPGFRLMCEVFNVSPGTVHSCADILKEGHVLGISPGGVREALFGDEYYRVMWGNRSGFAKVAIQTKVPIIPMFTMNIRESFRTPGWGRSSLRWLYEKCRLPIVPIYGNFPVKMTTYLGSPIYPSEDMTAEELADKVKLGIEDLIRKHQKVPGNVLRALSERILWKEKVS